MKRKHEGDVTKLPMWAQERIRDLERERDQALRTLHEFRDHQTPSKVWYEANLSTGEEQGPTTYRRYIQTHKVTFQIGPTEDDVVEFGLCEQGVLQILAGRLEAMSFHPWAANCIRIVSRTRHQEMKTL